jgi:hypothetical protein
MFEFIKDAARNGQEKIAEQKSRLISRSLRKAVEEINEIDAEETSNLIAKSSESRLTLEKMKKKYPDNKRINKSLEMAKLVEGLAALKMWKEV